MDWNSATHQRKVYNGEIKVIFLFVTLLSFQDLGLIKKQTFPSLRYHWFQDFYRLTAVVMDIANHMLFKPVSFMKEPEKR